MTAANWARLAPTPVVYPLIAAMAAGGGICIAMIGRTLVQGCDVRILKEDRQLGIPESDKFVKEGNAYYNSTWRNYFRTCNKEIWGAANESMGGGKYH
mmetsp:Transcript_22629/g.31548  ORF Transcript_22629/g.31548 Transcript_22629/m.31548 type:complete len:98 (-) Transcript_22629:359-652(-)|eukprot:CAMPEP_0196579618 /NCGR_PEP_ID=MMETSP1081-20130531/23577_1 /TAXON_ID=36882 /ORGANISM="Pyramimonas amylifera, Strain CCMP720" /LENGTH=97 /DNA_ID=CAMNT_0041899253 /DNA_START=109 /DNA_END=402 /DNA_ORIENTATION=+